MVPARSDKVSRVSSYSGFCLPDQPFDYGAFTLSGRSFQDRSSESFGWIMQSEPRVQAPGLGSSAFARRYLRNRFFFLFLRLLRCFSSPGSPRMVMDSPYGTTGPPWWVAPFRDLRIVVYLPLPAAFRSLSRLSSALSAKASALRPIQLYLCIDRLLVLGSSP